MKARLKKYKNHLTAYVALALIVLFLGITISVIQKIHYGKIYKNIYIGDLYFGNKTKKEAMDLLNQKTQALLDAGLSVNIQDKNVDLNFREYASGDPDLSRDLIKFNLEETINEAYKIARDKYNPLKNLIDLATITFNKKQVPAIFNIDKNSLLAYIKTQLQKYDLPKEDAKIIFKNNVAEIEPGRPGLVIDYEKLINDIKLSLENLETPAPTVNLIVENVEITKENLEVKKQEIETILKRAPFTLEYNKNKWTINIEELKKYLIPQKKSDKISIIISDEKINNLMLKIKNSINIPAKDAKFQIENGKVVGFSSSQLGLEVDTEDTLRLLNSIMLTGPTKVNIIVKSSLPKITTANANELGVSELLGVGTSDFTGSPTNRRHNIKTGAEKLNGLLIAPGEEFSLLNALGDIDEVNGFKPELVIKGDRTVKEFGGGLCQIGTTIFRATLSSGLPITERQNHSYRVSYYEPAGTDATIYDPAPDYKFINDTSGHILIQTKMDDDNKLYFEFWGKNDGRTATSTYPVIYNITNPPEPKFIISSEIAPGEKRKIESAHKGASAFFTYNIDYADENKKDIEKTFYSYYRPWPEVWMIGATSTPQQSL